MSKSNPNIGLYVTCLIDISAPEIGFAAANLLEKAGCTVNVPAQTCCGQPAYNNGNRADAIEIAKSTISIFERFDQLVVPSASCAGMIRHHYPQLFEEGSSWNQRALELAPRTFELIDYLYTKRGMQTIEGELSGRVAYHESCSALREMKTKGARELLSSLNGIDLIDLAGNEECCGFGGLFSVKYSAISNAIADAKLRTIKQQNIDLLTGVDLGCLQNLGGKLRRSGLDIKVCHVAELLANAA